MESALPEIFSGGINDENGDADFLLKREPLAASLAPWFLAFDESKHPRDAQGQWTETLQSFAKGTKVVNEDGSPKIVYHGSPYAFTEFGDPTKDSYMLDRNLGSHFAEDANVTNTFTIGQYAWPSDFNIPSDYGYPESRGAWYRDKKGEIKYDGTVAVVKDDGSIEPYDKAKHGSTYGISERLGGGAHLRVIPPGGSVYPVYLSIKNPLVIEPEGNEMDQTAIARTVARLVAPRDKQLFVDAIVQNQGINSTEAANIYDTLKAGKEYKRMENEKYTSIEDYVKDFSTMFNGKEFADRAKKILQDLGYDGIKYQNTSNNEIKGVKNNWTWIAFEPTQIKSVLNKGTFDTTKKNISLAYDESKHPRDAAGKWTSIGGYRDVEQAESDPNYVYHGTSEERAYDIAQSGLETHEPSFGTEDQDVWPDASDEPRSYFSGTARVTASFLPEGKAALLRVRRDAHEFKEESGTRDIYATKPVAPEHIEIMGGDGKWYPIKDLLKDLSLAYDESKHPRGEAGRWVSSGSKQTETQAFKDWSGGKELRTVKGEPMVLLHQTPNEFKEFTPGGDDLNKSGQAIWLAGPGSDPSRLQSAHNTEGRGKAAYREGVSVLPVFAKMNKPLIIDDDTRDWAIATFDDGRGSLPYRVSYDAYKKIIAEGYDGILGYKHGQTHGVDEPYEVIVFDGSQIKSAIGNIGTFRKDTKRLDLSLALRPYFDKLALLLAFDESKHPRDNDGKWIATTHGELAATYPKLKTGIVDGRQVTKDVPNTSSISSSLDNYETMPGIREVSMASFGNEDYKPKPYSVSEAKRLATLTEKLRESNRIAPLIVVVDKEGPYILEGGHRFDALVNLGAKSFPAMVVIDRDSLPNRLALAYDESEHPRNEQGEWTEKGGGGRKAELETKLAETEALLVPIVKRQKEIEAAKEQTDELREAYNAVWRELTPINSQIRAIKDELDIHKYLTPSKVQAELEIAEGLDISKESAQLILDNSFKRDWLDESPWAAARYKYKLTGRRDGYGVNDIWHFEMSAKNAPEPMPENVLDEVPHREGYVYRGMSAEEWKASKESGQLQSLGAMNMDQDGYTFYGKARTGQSYAGGFAPVNYTTAPGLPGVIVEIPRSFVKSHEDDPDKIPETEFAHKGSVPVSEVTGVWELPVVGTKPGYQEIAFNNGVARNTNANPVHMPYVVVKSKDHPNV